MKGPGPGLKLRYCAKQKMVPRFRRWTREGLTRSVASKIISSTKVFRPNYNWSLKVAALSGTYKEIDVETMSRRNTKSTGSEMPSFQKVNVLDGTSIRRTALDQVSGLSSYFRRMIGSQSLLVPRWATIVRVVDLHLTIFLELRICQLYPTCGHPDVF